MPAAPFLAFGGRTLLVGGLLLVVASCASTASGSGSGGQESTGSVGSAPPARTAHPGPPATSAAPPSVDPACARTPSTIAARIGERPAPVCLRVGQSLTISTAASPAQPWQPMTASDASVLACTSQPAEQGALTATCRALRPGTATVSTTTAPFAGDPHGPPQYIWTLTVHVQPAS